MTPDERRRRIEDLIEASSLGTPDAVAMRGRTSPERARRVIERSKEVAVTDAERQAQEWHDERVAADPDHEQFSACWCCCISCDPDWGGGNPHWSAARAGRETS